MTSSPTSALFENTIAALGMELVAAREAGRAPHLLDGGRRLGIDPVGAMYQFSLVYESAVPEGVPVQLEVAGRRWAAEVLRRDGTRILLLVQRAEGDLPNESIPSAALHANASYLLEFLGDAIRQLSEKERRTRPCNELIDRLLGRDPSPMPSAEPEVHPFLNREQSAAFERCLTQPVWLVWGPPGTGKTRTLGAVVAACVARGESVLVVAHSNVAVDATVVASVAAIDDAGTHPATSAVRAGPAVLERVRETSCSSRDRAFAERPDLRDRLNSLAAEFEKPGSNGMGELLRSWNETMAELRNIEEAIIAGSPVVCATLSKVLVSEPLRERQFDVVIVDEVSMTYPAQVLMVADRAKRRLGVFGDCRQLPPIVQSKADLAREHLGRDVFTAWEPTHRMPEA